MNDDGSQTDLFGPRAGAPVRGPVGPADAGRDDASLAASLPPALRLGTSSWTFPGWAGTVYDREVPPSLLARFGLHAYARHPLLRTVGMDRTYYRSEPLEQYRRWRSAVPSSFRFVVKAHRGLTVPGPTPRRRVSEPSFLDAVAARREVVEPALEGLGETLGVLLFQFPPMDPRRSFESPIRFAERLGRFLKALPAGPSYAVEIRNPELFTDAYRDALAGAGAVHAFTVHPRMLSLADQLAALPPSACRPLVIRWMLRRDLEYEAARERYQPFDRIVDPDPGTREAVGEACVEALAAGGAAFVVANNKAEGSAPLTVRALAGWLSKRARQDSNLGPSA